MLIRLMPKRGHEYNICSPVLEEEQLQVREKLCMPKQDSEIVTAEPKSRASRWKFEISLMRVITAGNQRVFYELHGPNLLF